MSDDAAVPAVAAQHTRLPFPQLSYLSGFFSSYLIPPLLFWFGRFCLPAGLDLLLTALAVYFSLFLHFCVILSHSTPGVLR